MNVLWRVVWKEYRTQRALWLTIAATAIGLQLLFAWGISDEAAKNGLFIAAMVFPVLYALAASCVSFAAEREEATWDFLRHLAAPPGRLLAGKLATGIVSTALMLLLLWFITALVSPQLLPVETRDLTLAVWQAGGLLCIEVLLWGVFFSLLVKRVLNAVCLTTLAVLAAHVFHPFRLITGSSDTLTGISVQGFHLFHPYHLYGLPLLLAVDVWLARRWMGSRAWLRFTVEQTFLPATRPQTSMPAAQTAWPIEAAPPGRRPLQRLVWQEWRHARGFLGIYLTVCCILLLVSGTQIRVIPTAYFAFLILPNTPLLLGLWAFHAEQQGQRFRFLAERGVAPQRVWLSKHVVWFGATVAVSLIFVATYWLGQQSPARDKMPYFWEFFDGRDAQSSSVAGWVVLYVCMSYSIGQFVSLLIPRSVTAVFVGAVLNYLLLCWMVVLDSLHVPLIWSVGSIPLVLLGATLLRCGDWLLERNGPRNWLRVSSAVVFPAVALVACVAAYRVWEVPGGGPGFNVNEISLEASAEEAGTAAIYQQASDVVLSPVTPDARRDIIGWEYAYAAAEEQEWLKANQRALELVLVASSRPEGVFEARRDAESWTQTRIDKPLWLGNLLLLSARDLEAEGKLDDALERYIAGLRLARHMAHRSGVGLWLTSNRLQQRIYQWLPIWAICDGQQPHKIMMAIDRIQRETANFPPASAALKMEYLVRRQILSLDLPTRARLLGRNDGPLEPYLMERIAPWESARARRVLDAVTAESLATLLEMEVLLTRRGVDLIDWQKGTFRHDDVGLVTRTRSWVQTTPLVFPQDDTMAADDLVIMRIDTEAYRAGCLMRLALLKWRLEHRRLPSRLEEVGGDALAYAVDPWSGQMFGYLPEHSYHAYLTFSNMRSLPTPLLWSPGVGGARLIPSGENAHHQVRYTIVGGWAGARARPGPGRIGLGFPIPNSRADF